jgi:hypothetical protein
MVKPVEFDRACVPLHAPPAEQAVASDVAQVATAEPPCGTLGGLREKATVGAAGLAGTTVVVVALEVPAVEAPGPLFAEQADNTAAVSAPRKIRVLIVIMNGSCA